MNVPNYLDKVRASVEKLEAPEAIAAQEAHVAYLEALAEFIRRAHVLKDDVPDHAKEIFDLSVDIHLALCDTQIMDVLDNFADATAQTISLHEALNTMMALVDSDRPSNPELN